MAGMRSKWRLADVVDFEVLLSESGGAGEARRHREEVGLALEGLRTSNERVRRRRGLMAWLESRRDEVEEPVGERVTGALKAMPIKTDRRDAEGIARLLHLGWFRPVPCKSVSAQEGRAILSARKAIQQNMIGLMFTQYVVNQIGRKCDLLTGLALAGMLPFNQSGYHGDLTEGAPQQMRILHPIDKFLGQYVGR